LIGEYNYASGNQDPRGRVRGTFDQLYPTGHDKYGLADQVGWRNIEDMRFGVELRPSAKWLLVENFHNWWLASANDGLYNAAGAMIVTPVNGPASRHVGEELDAQAVYTVSKQVQIGAGFAHIFPGAFLKQATPGKAYNFPYLMVTYGF
jgi:hypothetical protein